MSKFLRSFIVLSVLLFCVHGCFQHSKNQPKISFHKWFASYSGLS